METVAKSRTYPWLDRLLKADDRMERLSREYEATLGNRDALIASPEWECFTDAVEKRDALRERYWPQLLQLAITGRGHLGQFPLLLKTEPKRAKDGQ